MKLRAFIDGGSRGNPGPAAAGVVIQEADSGVALLEAGFFLGPMTNNQAEYHALIRAATLAPDYGCESLQINADSELLVEQISGRYKVKSPKLKPLYEEAMQKLNALGAWSISHVYREENARADKLANRAMDKKADVDMTGELDAPASPRPRNGAITCPHCGKAFDPDRA